MAVSKPFSLLPVSGCLPVHIHVLSHSWHYVLIIKTCPIPSVSPFDSPDQLSEFPSSTQSVVAPRFGSNQFSSRSDALSQCHSTSNILGVYLDLWDGQCHWAIHSFTGMKLHPKYKEQTSTVRYPHLFVISVTLLVVCLLKFSWETKPFEGVPLIICFMVEGPNQDTLFPCDIFVCSLEVHGGAIQSITRNWKIKLDQ